ncbi:hypothetical protein BDQ94DRAFT_105841 [Aspergillus welwitschiae]|uniref:Uncharacterized protein n=1 Tax=Aspergillus welwitschiae TaxID=1341132 RepID=A0A3F3QCZ1_9EURO|nr:hypothetical protein BDQ94DRAFT_105841 [Aspergillus welwitschiae]RDH37134.1 hypothetical protein BDQ94DRAFT_105841 [Aspergillus welwitschiae]
MQQMQRTDPVDWPLGNTRHFRPSRDPSCRFSSLPNLSPHRVSSFHLEDPSIPVSCSTVHLPMAAKSCIAVCLPTNQPTARSPHVPTRVISVHHRT